MLKALKCIRMGMGNLPHCGRHPGTDFFAIMVMISGLACGNSGGLAGVIFGSSMAALCFGSIYLYGAYSRAKFDERLSAAQGPVDIAPDPSDIRE